MRFSPDPLGPPLYKVYGNHVNQEAGSGNSRFHLFAHCTCRMQTGGRPGINLG